jgi:hypothetical protein
MKSAFLWSAITVLLGAAGAGIAYGLSILIPTLLY